MSSEPNAASAREHHLQTVLAEYLEAVDACRPPDRQAFLANHPDLADDLRRFFANQDQINRLAEPLRPPAGGSDIPSPVSRTEASPGGETLSLPTGEISPAEPVPGVRVGYFPDYELLE